SAWRRRRTPGALVLSVDDRSGRAAGDGLRVPDGPVVRRHLPERWPARGGMAFVLPPAGSVRPSSFDARRGATGRTRGAEAPTPTPGHPHAVIAHLADHQRDPVDPGTPPRSRRGVLLLCCRVRTGVRSHAAADGGHHRVPPDG